MRRKVYLIATLCWVVSAFAGHSIAQCNWEWAEPREPMQAERLRGVPNAHEQPTGLAATAGSYFYDLVWAGNHFVGLASDPGGAVVMDSMDGATWTALHQLEGLPGGLLNWDGTRLLCVSPPHVLTSSDAVAWAEVDSDFGGINPHFLAWSGDRFLAGVPPLWSGSHTIVSSVDGATWVRSSPPSGEARGAVSTGSLFVEVGGPNPVVGVSTDAETWTAQVIDAGPLPYLNDVAWNGSLLMAVGRQGLIMTSPDGLTWTRHELGTAFDLYGVATVAGGFVVGGSAGTILATTDARVWVTEDTPTLDTVTKIVPGDSITLAMAASRLLLRHCNEPRSPGGRLDVP